EKKSGEGNTGTPSKDKRISPSDVGNSAISKPNLPKASPDAAKHSDMDRPVVSYNQKRLTNDDKKEDKRQEETVEDKLRQSLENNEQLLKRCNDIQKEYENVKKDYAEMERKFESISKEKEDLLVTNNTVTKERDETIQAYKELGGKDIDNQGTILELKTNVSDIQKRYNDMENCKSKVENQLTEEQKSWRQEKCRHKNEIEKANKAYNEVTKQLKEERKSWTQEKSNLQKEHDDESKKHKKEIDKLNKAYNEVTKQLKEERKSWTQEKSNLQKKHDDESKKDKKEIDKANKAIGSLNQKVADKEEELKKKKNFMEKLIREKKEVDEKNTMHEKNIAILQENIKKLTEQKIKDEREHNKKVKDLTREINAERDNFSGLSYQYNELVKQIQSLQEENRSLTREKQELLLRLSKVAGANLTYNNPNIADLSDEKRPTKLAEEFSELYDNEWTDAFEDLQFENEKEKTTFMLGLVMVWKFICFLFIQISGCHLIIRLQ
ncbi:uncharacterized protein LOC128552561, partial [Mercenaria mercenaria]|uniref:uncharacterized protein LOC128552561 n=1 Tax=Mercenaria mercenaria TaxID=6596 RepID=UPI00234F1D17